MTPTVMCRILLCALWFGTISAVGGGAMLVVTNGAGIPLEYLLGTPFDSYVVPGLILGIVIGGTQGLGAVTLQRRHRYGAAAAAVAGFGMMVWIFVEIALLQEFSGLQVVYFVLGLLEVGMVLLLLGLLEVVGPRWRGVLSRANRARDNWWSST